MKTFAIALTLTAAAATAQADWKRLTGDPAPNLEATHWFNKAEGSAVEDFRGKAVLVEFWATW
ncbi:MAG: hypothetical protein V3T86_00875 [Planctomycetota bacterium]